MDFSVVELEDGLRIRYGRRMLQVKVMKLKITRAREPRRPMLPRASWSSEDPGAGGGCS